MKYMGSKRSMLMNGLGETLDAEIRRATRFVDLFLGSGEVASFVARRHEVPTFGVDLQAYSVFLAEAVIGRCQETRWGPRWERWIASAETQVKRTRLPNRWRSGRFSRAAVDEAREWAAQQTNLPVTAAYGGHYFSPQQSVLIDSLRMTLPKSGDMRAVGMAVLLRAASQCVAAPGHTAQPFQPTRTAAKYLKEAWLRDPVSRIRTAFELAAGQFAKCMGAARVADANELASNLEDGDLVFIDPPYSGVQYSRFYHVLETIARGECGEVNGVGRYPRSEVRPTSSYSLAGESEAALNQLLFLVATAGANAILTFPLHECSNGLSGSIVQEISSAHFRIKVRRVKSKFSTLGGRGSGTDKVAKRQARHDAEELLLVLRPR